MQYIVVKSDGYLEHHGVKGQKHGERRYQNEDGSLTPEGREHYGVGQGDKYRNADGSLTKKGVKEAARIEKFRNSNSVIANNMRRSGQRLGMSDSQIYGSYKMSRAAMIGTILAGPLVGITAAAVSNHRYKKSGEAFAKTILG